jgi:CRP/FNR family transcriptional regulator, cyclic AMP receptor protein
VVFRPGPRSFRFPPMSRRDAFLDHLAQVPLFSALSRKELALVAKRAEDVKVDAGRILVSEGSTGSEFFVIVDGEAAVSRKGRKLATLSPGDAFGELALLDKAPRNATVTAISPMEVVVLGQREFGGLIDEVPGFARKLLAGMARRLREADAKSVQ